MSLAELGHSQILLENAQDPVANGKQNVPPEQVGLPEQEAGGFNEEVWDPLSSSCERLIQNESNVQIEVTNNSINAKIPVNAKKPYHQRKSTKFFAIFIVFLLIIVITFFSVNFHHTKSVKSELRHIKDNHIAGLQQKTADLEQRSSKLELLLNQTIQAHTEEIRHLKEHSEIQENLLNQTLLRLNEMDDLKDRTDGLELLVNKTIIKIDEVEEHFVNLVKETDEVEERVDDTEQKVNQLQKDRDDLKKITQNLKGEVKHVYELRKDQPFDPKYMRNSASVTNSIITFSTLLFLSMGLTYEVC